MSDMLGSLLIRAISETKKLLVATLAVILPPSLRSSSNLSKLKAMKMINVVISVINVVIIITAIIIIIMKTSLVCVGVGVCGTLHATDMITKVRFL